MERRQIVHNSMQTPDGTIISSNHRHDYVCHKDKNGETFCVDGGCDYLSRTGNTKVCKDLSLYADDPHEVIREYVVRGGRGINGDEPLKYVVLKEINEDWLLAIIKYEEEFRPGNLYLPIYRAEVEWRKLNNITIWEK